LRESPAHHAIAARDVQHDLAGSNLQQSLTRRTDQDPLELLALAHPCVPELSLALPELLVLAVELSWIARAALDPHRDSPQGYATAKCR